MKKYISFIICLFKNFPTGRINSAQKGKSTTDIGMYEINYEPEDESIHIEQTANKTNFINKWKN